jgi:hypothetical protein
LLFQKNGVNVKSLEDSGSRRGTEEKNACVTKLDNTIRVLQQKQFSPRITRIALIYTDQQIARIAGIAKKSKLKLLGRFALISGDFGISRISGNCPIRVIRSEGLDFCSRQIYKKYLHAAGQHQCDVVRLLG